MGQTFRPMGINDSTCFHPAAAPSATVIGEVVSDKLPSDHAPVMVSFAEPLLVPIPGLISPGGWCVLLSTGRG